MWFLLSLNLSHWIGSFTTVGLDSHLGFRQKGLREAKSLDFSFLREEERRRAESAEERREWARFSRQLVEETSSGHEYRGAFIAVRIAQKSRVCTACIYCCTDCINCWHSFLGRIFWHRNRGGFAGHVFQDFEMKSWVEISWIFTVFLFWYFCWR